VLSGYYICTFPNFFYKEEFFTIKNLSNLPVGEFCAFYRHLYAVAEYFYVLLSKLLFEICYKTQRITYRQYETTLKFKNRGFSTWAQTLKKQFVIIASYYI